MTKHHLPETEIINAAPECQIISSRVLDTPVEKVFDAWADPEKLARWWGPKGFTNTFNQFDLQPGGKWSFIMHGPDKGHYPNECVFLDIVKNEKLVWNHISEPQFQIVVHFEQQPEKTKVIFRMIFESAEKCNKIKSFAVEKNQENFDRLEEVLRAG
jgi:uncharacterized protein YndB with AHSA1/START domain